MSKPSCHNSYQDINTICLFEPSFNRLNIIRLDSLIKDLFSLFVILAINILEAFSYGILIFPATLLAAFPTLLSPLDGICMFIQSTALAQLILTHFTSFKTSSIVAGMMIENIPFMTSMSNYILTNSTDKTKVIPTILFCFSFGTFLIALSFYFVYRFKLSNYFKILPQYLLDGLLTGIGIFLIIVAIQLCYQFNQNEINSNQQLNINYLQIGLAALMGLIIFFFNQHLSNFQFSIPLFTISFVGLFWFLFRVVLGKSFEEIVNTDWFLHLQTSSVSFSSLFNYYSLFSVSKIDWKLVIELIPVFIASTVFGLLHVPINIPAFAYCTNQIEDCCFDGEIFAHSLSNFVCSFISLIPNYLVYSTSTLFFKLGNRPSSGVSSSKWKGYLLGFLTLLIPYFGIGLVRIIPKIVLGGFMFYLGYDLVWYAGIVPLFTIGNWLERIIIVTIAITCNIWGFSIGLFVGSIGTLILICYRINWFGIQVEESGNYKYNHVYNFCLLIRITGNLSFLNSINAIGTCCELITSNCDKKYVVFDVTDCTLIDNSFVSSLIANSFNFDGKFFVVQEENLAIGGRGETTALRNYSKGEFLYFDRLDKCFEWIENDLAIDV